MKFLILISLLITSQVFAFRPKVYDNGEKTDCDRYAFEMGCWSIGGSLTFQERGAGAGLSLGYYLLPQTAITLNGDLMGYSNAVNQPANSAENPSTSLVKYGPGISVALPVMDDIHLMPFVNFMHAEYSGEFSGTRFMISPGLNLVYAISNIVIGVNFSYWIASDLPVGESMAFSPVFAWHF